MNQYINDINVIIIGDTNVNMLKPNLLKDCLDINGLRNVIKEPTCFKCTPSLIDLCITNRSQGRIQDFLIGGGGVGGN